MQVYEVKKSQNLFDVALACHGSIEGIFDLLVNNENLSFETVLEEGDELYWDEDFVINGDIVTELDSTLNIIPANGERHVYYKETEEPLCCVITVSEEDASITLKMSGDGVMTVDWGDNTELEEIELQSTLQTYCHFFDNETDKRVVRLYGSFNVKTWELSPINGLVLPVMPLVVDEVVSEKNKLSLNGLFMFGGTYSVMLKDMSISSLSPIQDMGLSDLTLTGNEYPTDSVVDDYLIYVAKNNNERRNCKVTLDVQPSGEYQEPSKDSNGNYDIKTGMEAIYVITHEDAWNEAGAWEFDINGTIYKYENPDIA